jgi:uncharacterized protein YbjQ (UPF0145 family)
VDSVWIELAGNIGLPLLLLVLGYVTGTIVEHSHYRDIRVRESKTRRLPVTTFRRPPSHWEVRDVAYVAGNVVISIDYFKRFLAGLRALVGGRVTAYESLLDRARREAVLRMKEEALERGFDAVINVRLETSRLASAKRNGKGTAGVEILAFGTALKHGA